MSTRDPRVDPQPGDEVRIRKLARKFGKSFSWSVWYRVLARTSRHVDLEARTTDLPWGPVGEHTIRWWENSMRRAEVIHPPKVPDAAHE
jgi:hypothetical protein